MWRRRQSWFGRMALAGSVLVTTWWATVLLGRSSSWMPSLRWAVLVVGVGTSLALLVAPASRRRLSILVGGLAILVSLAGPAAYTLDTVAVAHTGAIPSAGPTASGATGGPGGAGGFGPGGGGTLGTGSRPTGFGGALGASGRPTGVGVGVGAGPGSASAAGRQTARKGTPPTTGMKSAAGRGPGTATAPGTGAGTGPGGAVGAGGGILDAATPGKALTRLLEANASHYTWVAATVGSESAAGYQLATDDPVMSIGGFNGSDPTPTLAQFEADVRAGKIHYFIGGGTGGGGMAGGGAGGSTSTSTGSAITSWVEAHFTAKTVDGVTIYDLSSSTVG
jgi:hypothetical protein